MKRMKFLHGLLFIFLHPEHKMLLRHSVLGELGCSRSRHFQSKGRKVRPWGRLSWLWLNMQLAEGLSCQTCW